MEANIYDPKTNLIESISVRELTDFLSNYEKDILAVVFDGVITQRLVDIAAEKKIQFLIGARKSNLTKIPMKMKIVTFDQINVSN